jgi:hypothetical protein
MVEDRYKTSHPYEKQKKGGRNMSVTVYDVTQFPELPLELRAMIKAVFASVLLGVEEQRSETVSYGYARYVAQRPGRSTMSDQEFHFAFEFLYSIGAIIEGESSAGEEVSPEGCNVRELEVKPNFQNEYIIEK